MSMTEPTREHAWLEQLHGDWTYEVECVMGPDQPPSTMTGTDSTRGLGALWAISEWSNTPTGDQGGSRSIMTLGYDPDRKLFVGTFVSDCMGHLWTYTGELDTTGKVLTLTAQGPSFSGQGMTKYHDIHEIVDADHRILRSEALGPDGQWTGFMTMRITRVGA
jgi:hypothetical protein